MAQTLKCEKILKISGGPFCLVQALKKIFKYGQRAEAITLLDIYAKHPQIKRALNALTDHSLVENEAEHKALTSVYNSLMEGPSRGDCRPLFCP